MTSIGALNKDNGVHMNDKIICPRCKKAYELNVRSIPHFGLNVVCSSCHYSWVLFKKDIVSSNTHDQKIVYMSGFDHGDTLKASKSSFDGQTDLAFLKKKHFSKKNISFSKFLDKSKTFFALHSITKKKNVKVSKDTCGYHYSPKSLFCFTMAFFIPFCLFTTYLIFEYYQSTEKKEPFVKKKARSEEKKKSSSLFQTNNKSFTKSSPVKPAKDFVLEDVEYSIKSGEVVVVGQLYNPNKEKVDVPHMMIILWEDEEDAKTSNEKAKPKEDNFSPERTLFSSKRILKKIPYEWSQSVIMPHERVLFEASIPMKRNDKVSSVEVNVS